MTNDESYKKKRITYQLYEYWDTMREGRKFPALEDIHPEDVADIWPDCFLIEVEEGDASAFSEIYGGQAIRDMRADLEEDSLAFFQDQIDQLSHEVVRFKRPLKADYSFLDTEGNEIRYRQILLPLGQDSNVDHILGGMRYKLFEKES